MIFSFEKTVNVMGVVHYVLQLQALEHVRPQPLERQLCTVL